MLGMRACVRVEEGRKTQPFFCFFPYGEMDRLPVFVRLSISGASQVGEGKGALKAEVGPTTRKRFHGGEGVHWIRLVMSIGQGFSRQK